MNVLNIAVCDDEEVICRQIKELIEKRMADSCIDVYDSGKKLLAAEKLYDMVFLDIQMDGINGIETARALREKQNDKTVIIFITAMKEYVFEAFDVSAFHYLLKPIDETKFTEVLRRAAWEVESRRKQEQEPLLIRTKKRSMTFLKNDILYVESRGKKVEIHTKEKNIEIYASMNELESQLGSGFYRCHRGYLVNMIYIAEYSGEDITLSNGETVYLSKEKYSEFVKTYMRFVKNGGLGNGSFIW